MNDKFRALMEKWRSTADVLSVRDPRSYAHRVALNACADELEALLPPSEAGEGDKPVVWCLHLRGPDDVFAAPSREAAEHAARLVNERFANHEVKPNAVAAVWPHSAESHAESLKDWAEQWGGHDCGTCGGGGYVLDHWQTAADCPSCNTGPTATPPAAEVDARDSARLDFMVNRGASVDCHYDGHRMHYRVVAFGDQLTDWHESYREALDAALRPFTEENAK